MIPKIERYQTLGGMLAIRSPNHPDLGKLALRIGGQWHEETKCWHYHPGKVALVDGIYRHVYGVSINGQIDPDDTLVDALVTVGKKHWRVKNQSVYLFGRELILAHGPGHEYSVTLNGLRFLVGSYDVEPLPAGGWQVIVRCGSTLLVPDVPLSLVRQLAYDTGNDCLFRTAGHIPHDQPTDDEVTLNALSAERDAIAARLQEINHILAAVHDNEPEHTALS